MLARIRGTRKLGFALFFGLAAVGFVGCGGGAANDEPPAITGDAVVEAQKNYQEIQAKEAAAGKTP